MSRILVLGGYGGFGARISRRLAAAGQDVLVGGRDFAKAERFCASTPGTTPVEVDRQAGLLAVVASCKPDILVDAAGPFQGSGYDVVEACIASGVHYLDIADGRDFVTGVRAFDEAARAAGVVVISRACRRCRGRSCAIWPRASTASARSRSPSAPRTRPRPAPR